MNKRVSWVELSVMSMLIARVKYNKRSKQNKPCEFKSTHENNQTDAQIQHHTIPSMPSLPRHCMSISIYLDYNIFPGQA